MEVYIFILTRHSKSNMLMSNCRDKQRQLYICLNRLIRSDVHDGNGNYIMRPYYDFSCVILWTASWDHITCHVSYEPPHETIWLLLCHMKNLMRPYDFSCVIWAISWDLICHMNNLMRPYEQPHQYLYNTMRSHMTIYMSHMILIKSHMIIL